MSKEPPKISTRQKSTPREIHREFFSADDFERAMTEKGQSIEITITEIHPSPYQTRSLRPNHFAELKANIKANGIIMPILVRKRERGGFEYIAGHHRGAAAAELGQETIKAVIVDMNDKEASASVFYDNLHGPDLQDYEKYLGLLKRQEDTGFTYIQLADESGLSRSQVTKLFSYKTLPQACHLILKQNPDILGSNTAEALKKYTSATQEPLVIQALEKIREKTLKETNACSWIESNLKPNTNKRQDPVTIFGSNKKIFCRIQQADKALRLSFNSPHEAASLTQAIEKTIRDFITKQINP